MKKILFVARLAEHIRHFHIPYIDWLKSMGYQVDLITCGDEEIENIDKHYKVPMDRSPIKLKNVKAYYQMKNIVDHGEYDLIHCHMPLTGMLTRFAARKARSNGTKVIYTAHGFHFFKGASLINWLIYYPAEKIASYFTDDMITINQEDYNFSEKYLNSKNNTLVNGVGIDSSKFKLPESDEKVQLRVKHSISKDSFVLIYVAELSHRKHQDMLIEVARLLKPHIPKLQILLVGRGVKHQEYLAMIESYDLQDTVKLLGYRSDVEELMMLSDLAVSTSRQEGLPVNIMEAMGTGLPAVVTNCRGNRDLITHLENGVVVDMDDVESMAVAVQRLYEDRNLRIEMGNSGHGKIAAYSMDTVLKQMKTVYLTHL